MKVGLRDHAAGSKGPMPAPRWRPVEIKGGRLSQTIIQDREDRF
jgi:hypothetical protein